MIPKIEFEHSWLYDSRLKRRRGFVMPKEAEFWRGIAKLEKRWKKIELRVLREISRVTKLRWQEKDVVCYMTAGVRPYSNPITISLRKDVGEMIDTLVHELIHRIYSEPENFKRVKKNWYGIVKRYEKYSRTTKYHVSILAVHEHILRKYFTKKSLERQREANGNKDYIRAWAIVEKEGYRNIIKKLTRGL